MMGLSEKKQGRVPPSYFSKFWSILGAEKLILGQKSCFLIFSPGGVIKLKFLGSFTACTGWSCIKLMGLSEKNIGRVPPSYFSKFWSILGAEKLIFGQKSWFLIFSPGGVIKLKFLGSFTACTGVILYQNDGLESSFLGKNHAFWYSVQGGW